MAFRPRLNTATLRTGVNVVRRNFGGQSAKRPLFAPMVAKSAAVLAVGSVAALTYKKMQEHNIGIFPVLNASAVCI